MDKARKNKAAIFTVVLSATILCSLASWFFTMVGASLGEIGIVSLVKWSNLIWSVWGITWGAVCGICAAHLLIKTLIKKRRILIGVIYGISVGIIIGSVNGFLTSTIIFGIIEGLVLGAIGGLILSTVFLNMYKEN